MITLDPDTVTVTATVAAQAVAELVTPRQIPIGADDFWVFDISGAIAVQPLGGYAGSPTDNQRRGVLILHTATDPGSGSVLGYATIHEEFDSTTGDYLIWETWTISANPIPAAFRIYSYSKLVNEPEMEAWIPSAGTNQRLATQFIAKADLSGATTRTFQWYGFSDGTDAKVPLGAYRLTFTSTEGAEVQLYCRKQPSADGTSRLTFDRPTWRATGEAASLVESSTLRSDTALVASQLSADLAGLVMKPASD